MFVACDVSGINGGGRYWVLGSTWIETKQLSQFEKAVCEFRIKNKIWGELKWGKVAKRWPIYRQFLELAINEFGIETKLMVVDTKKVIPTSKGTNVLISKLYYQLIKNHMTNRTEYGYRPSTYRIILDKDDWAREQSLTLKNVLKIFAIGVPGNAVAHLGSCDSKISSMLQLCDVITGATCAAWNQQAGVGKMGIIKDIEKLLGASLSLPTLLPSSNKFNIWFFRPRRQNRAFAL